MTRIVKFNAGDKPLTPKMLQTLKDCFQKESNNEAFGPKEVKGSFGALVSRGLLDTKTICLNIGIDYSWYITNLGLHVLKTYNLLTDKRKSIP